MAPSSILPQGAARLHCARRDHGGRCRPIRQSGRVASHLGATEINELQPEGGGIHEEVVGLKITVANVLGVNVLERLERLVKVDANMINRETLPLLLELQGNAALLLVT